MVIKMKEDKTKEVEIKEVKVIDEITNKILVTRGKELSLTVKDGPMIKKIVGATLEAIMN